MSGMISIGMMPIKNIEYDLSQKGSLWANLWINSQKSIIPLQQTVAVTVLEECDPMYEIDDSEKEGVKKLLPLTLYGEIHQIKSLSNGEIRNIKTFLKNGSEPS